MPFLDTLQENTRELGDKIKNEVNTSLERSKPVKKTNILRAITAEQELENIRHRQNPELVGFSKEEKEYRKDLIGNLEWLLNIEPKKPRSDTWMGHAAQVMDKIVDQGKESDVKSFREAFLKGDTKKAKELFDKINPEIRDYPRLFNRNPHLTMEDLHDIYTSNPANIAYKDLKEPLQKKPVKSPQGFAEWSLNKYGVRVPFEESVYNNAPYENAGIPNIPHTLPELREMLGLPKDTPIPGNKLKEFADFKKHEEAFKDYIKRKMTISSLKHMGSNQDPEHVKRIEDEYKKIEDAKKEVLKSGLESRALWMEPREAALLKGERPLPHHPITEEVMVTPNIFQGKTFADLTPDQQKSFEEMRTLAEAYKGKGEEWEKDYKNLGDTLKGYTKPSADVATAIGLQSAANLKTPYEDYLKNVRQSELSDPVMLDALQDATKQFDLMKDKMNSNFEQMLPAMRGRFLRNGNWLSSSSRAAEDSLILKHQDQLAREYQNMLSGARKFGVEAIDRRRSHEFRGNQALSEAARQQNELYANQASMRMKAVEADAERERKLLETGHLGQAKALAGQEAANRERLGVGNALQQNEQSRLNDVYRQFNVQRDRPYDELARAVNIMQGTPSQNFQTELGLPPVPQAPNNAAANASIMLNMGQQLGNYQQDQAMREAAARGQVQYTVNRAKGGVVTSRDLLNNYNNQMEAYEKAARRYQDQEIQNTAGWDSIGDLAKNFALAGARKISPLEGFANSIDSSQKRHGEHKKAVQTKALQNVALDKALTKSHGERWKGVATVEQKEADRAEIARHHRAVEKLASQRIDAASHKAQKSPANQKLYEEGRAQYRESMELMRQAIELQAMNQHVTTGPIGPWLPGDLAGLWSGGMGARGVFRQRTNALAGQKFENIKGNKAVGVLNFLQNVKGSVGNSREYNDAAFDQQVSLSGSSAQEGLAKMKRAGASVDDIESVVQETQHQQTPQLTENLTSFDKQLPDYEKKDFKDKSLTKATQRWDKYSKEMGEYGKAPAPKEHENIQGDKDQSLLNVQPQQNAAIEALYGDLLSGRPAGYSHGGQIGEKKKSKKEKSALEEAASFVGGGAKRAVSGLLALPELAGHGVDALTYFPRKAIKEVTGFETPSIGGDIIPAVRNAIMNIGGEYEQPENGWARTAHDAADMAAGVVSSGGVGKLLMEGGKKAAPYLGTKLGKVLPGVGKFLGGESFAQAAAGNTQALTTAVKQGAKLGAAESVLRNEMGAKNPLASNLTAAVVVPTAQGIGKRVAHAARQKLGKESGTLTARNNEERLIHHILGDQNKDKSKLHDYIDVLENVEQPLAGYNPTTAEALELAGKGVPNINALERLRHEVSPVLTPHRHEGLQHLSNKAKVFGEVPVNDISTQQLAADGRAALEEALKKSWEARTAASKPFYDAVDKHRTTFELTDLNKTLSHLEEFGVHESSKNLIKSIKSKLGNLKGESPGSNPLRETLGEEWWSKQDPSHQKKLLEQMGVSAGDVKPASFGAQVSKLRSDIRSHLDEAVNANDWSLVRTLNKIQHSLDSDIIRNIPASKKAVDTYRQYSKNVNDITHDNRISSVFDKDHYGYYSRGEAHVADNFLKGKDAPEAVRKLINILGPEHPFISQLGERAVDNMLKDFAKGGKDTFTPHAYNTALNRNKDVFKQILKPEQMQDLQDVGKVMASRGRVAQQATDGSATNPKGELVEKLLKSGPFDKVVDAAVDWGVGKVPGLRSLDLGKQLIQNRKDKRAAGLDQFLVNPKEAANVMRRSIERGNDTLKPDLSGSYASILAKGWV